MWNDEDVHNIDPQVKVIGAPLEVATNLYPELQRSYFSNSKVDGGAGDSRTLPDGVPGSLRPSSKIAPQHESTILHPNCAYHLPSDSTTHLSQDLEYQNLKEIQDPAHLHVHNTYIEGVMQKKALTDTCALLTPVLLSHDSGTFNSTLSGGSESSDYELIQSYETIHHNDSTLVASLVQQP